MMVVLLLVSLNDLELHVCGIGNEYLNNKFHEKIWNESSLEFGS